MEDITIVIPFIRPFNRMIALRVHNGGFSKKLPKILELDLSGLVDYITSQLKDFRGFKALEGFKFQVGFVDGGKANADLYHYNCVMFLDEHIISLRYIGEWNEA